MGWSIKKPLGGKRSIFQEVTRKPGATLGGAAVGAGAGFLHGGPIGALVGAGVGAATGIAATDSAARAHSAAAELSQHNADAAAAAQGDQEAIGRLAAEEEAKRRALGVQQQGQINDFANQQESSVANYRKVLAQHLSDTAQQTFQQANPGILEDLNSRGLFTSQTARDDSQNRALQQLATQQQSALSNFDTSEFNNIQDIRGSGLSALLGGDQSALDSALELRKSGIQRSFDVADQQRNQAFQQMLANQQNRQQMISSILGLGGSLGAAYLGSL